LAKQFPLALKIRRGEPTTIMPVIPEIAAFHDELVAIRRDFHSHPEIGFQERRTASIVAEHLTRWGIETLQGLAETGVVGVIRGEPASRSVGLRADMDALPVEELADVPFRSRVPGCMHACGHDGHMAMLLGAAKYLSATRRFSGSAVFIFQPAEEGLEARVRC
jgi:amidohydrolase